MARVICDETFCSGCLACVVACLDHHYDETEADAISPRIHEKWTSPRTGLVRYKTRSCLHCKKAKCMEVCPVGAFTRTASGFVVASREACIGCGACANVCTFDVPRFDKDGKIVKCDGCYQRVEAGLKPACVKVCNTGALHLGGNHEWKNH